MHEKFKRRRAKRKQAAPCLMHFRQSLRGCTYRRSKKETRGRKRNITFQREGTAVQPRRTRTKPDRTSLQAKARVEYCEAWNKKPASFFVAKVDMIIDNKKFDIPTTERARNYLQKQNTKLGRPPGGQAARCQM